MDKAGIWEITGQLLTTLQVLAGYPVPDALPEVHLVPQSVIAKLVCKAPCHVQAFYHPDFGVVMDEELRVEKEPYAQSILLHELVHHAQHISGRFETLASECHRRIAAESEAYEIQNKFLALHQAPQRIPLMRFSLPCPDE